jgi:NAD(P)-dependent dehydrogenase (short-subunit alcohol dehydrogenase family)
VGGVVAPGRPADIDAAGWMAELELNLTSVFYCLRAQIPALLGAGGGALVNNASIARAARRSRWTVGRPPAEHSAQLDVDNARSVRRDSPLLSTRRGDARSPILSHF